MTPRDSLLVEETINEEDFFFKWEPGRPIEVDLTEEEMIEVAACTTSCRYFIENFCWIEQKATREVLPFVPYDFQWEILKCLQEGRSIVANKSRRVGASWIVAAYAAWLTNFHEGVNVLFLSRKEDDAKKLLRKVKFILNNLTYRDAGHIRDATPANFLRNEIGIDNQQIFSIMFKDDFGNQIGSSEIASLTTTSESGRSEDATIVFWDEAAFCKPDDEATWSAILPTTLRGGQVVVVSTPNNVGGVFWQLVRQGEQKENDFFHFMEIHWSDAGITHDQVMRMKELLNMTEEKFLQEFELKFIQPGTAVFNKTYLDGCYKPLDEYPEIEEELRRYDEEVGFYYSGVDSSSGTYNKRREPDENAAVFFTRSGIEAHSVSNRKLIGDWAGKRVRNIHTGADDFQRGMVSELHFEWPGIMQIERFGYGDITYHNHVAPDWEGCEVYGIQPDQQTQARMMENFILAVEGQRVVITSKKLYNQMHDLQRGAHPGRYDPPPGGNDDVVKAAALAWDGLTHFGGEDLPEVAKVIKPNRASKTGIVGPPQMPKGKLPFGIVDADTMRRAKRMADEVGVIGKMPVPSLDGIAGPDGPEEWMRPR